MKKYKALAFLTAAGLVLSACSAAEQSAIPESTQEADLKENNEDNDKKEINSDNDNVSIIDTENVFSKRDLSGEYDENECEKIAISENGSFSDSDGVVTDGNTVTVNKEGTYIISGSSDDCSIIVDADKSEKVQLVLDNVNITSKTSAAIYVKGADKVFVTLTGTNTLANGGEFVAIDDNNIDAVIFSKDDLTLNGAGTLTINSPAGHAIVSKNDLVVASGSYNLTAAGHALCGKDSVAIADGSFDITAGKDGIHASNDEDEDAGWVYVENGTFAISVESDGISAINEINIINGKLIISESYEGLEARMIYISGGDIDITSSDDGLNATDKRNTSNQTLETSENDKKGFGGNDEQEGALIEISGGIININAQGDGIDTNGYLTVNDGEVYVSGSSGGGDGALDYGISAVINGGIVVATGQSGMAVNFCEGSTQGSILNNTDSAQAAGSDVVLLDAEQNEILRHTIEKGYNSVVISCPEIVDGAAYILKMGSQETEITMDGLIYGEGFSMGGMHGGFNGGKPGGERPDGEMPEGERPDGEMPGGERPDGERPDGEMPGGERPDGERPDGEMPNGGNGGMMPRGEEKNIGEGRQ